MQNIFEGIKKFWKTNLIIIFVILVALLTFAIYSLFAGFPWEEKEVAVIEPIVHSGPVIDEPVSKSMLEGADFLVYYNPDRDERYAAYAEQMPMLSVDDVVWMVDADLDKEPYSVTSEITEPESLTALINKYNALPHDYAPPDLVNIGQSMMRAEAAEAMNEMIEAAAADGFRLWVQSGYRSYGIQVTLYDRYSANDGVEGADIYSARPGHSEHQSGLTADLNTITDAFGLTPEGIWTAENCWQYGFIVRYTSENTNITHYKPEPWHMRYIGRDAAREMHELGMLSFEEYWVKHIKYPIPEQL